MARLVEGLSRFFGRVEILALGLESVRQRAELALANDRPLEARDAALEIVKAAPESPLGLALWADAAEDAWLDHEAAAALALLVRMVPWRADVWLRLGQARARIGERDEAREALERAASAPDERSFGRLALLELADLDLNAGDPARALRWLDRVAPTLASGSLDHEVALRRTECGLASRDLAAAHEASRGLGAPDTDSATDGRLALARAGLALGPMLEGKPLEPGDLALGLDPALRAFVLDASGASRLLARLLASTHDAVIVDRVRSVVRASGAIESPPWPAAFALAEGRRSDALRELAKSLDHADADASATLLLLGIEMRDEATLDALMARAPTLVPPAFRALHAALQLDHAGDRVKALEALDEVGGDASGWATDARRAIVRGWIPRDEVAVWDEVLRQLRRLARELDRIDLLSALEALAMERERPLRLAVVGEFNAGKSTFLNALLGEDVAPTGVLPTTATLHWVSWAPDPFARIVVQGKDDRVVQHAELKATLKEIVAEGARVERVHIYAPIERLKLVEVLDTPGFNAPDPDHIAAARRAFDEAHVALWLLDATHPLKDSERRVLEEIKNLGVPVQVLANKADRLGEEELSRVMEHVREGLAQAGLTPPAPPIALSARLALKGKLGDADALVASKWADVERLLSERIVDASAGLKERALRRKAGRIAVELAKAAAERSVAERESAARARDDAARLRAAATKLRTDRAAITASIGKSLGPSLALLGEDLKPIVAASKGRGREVVTPELAEYVAERVIARLGEPIGNELGAFAQTGAPERARSSVRAVLSGAVAAHDSGSELLTRLFDTTGDGRARLLDRVLDAALEAFAVAIAMEADRAIADEPTPVLELRAAAFLDVWG